jgi:hypothetical protein
MVEAESELANGPGSFVDELADAVFVMVVGLGVPGSVRTITLTVSLAFFARLAMVQLTVPFVPTGGVVHVKPPEVGSNSNTVNPGSGSLMATLWAVSGPLFATPIV